MFDRILKFFVENSRVNYTLFVLVFAIGIWSYTKTPKEIFPSFDLDMISIKGSYTGASVDILDKMAVVEIDCRRFETGQYLQHQSYVLSYMEVRRNYQNIWT